MSTLVGLFNAVVGVFFLWWGPLAIIIKNYLFQVTIAKFGITENFINTLALKRFILQLYIKRLHILNDCQLY